MKSILLLLILFVSFSTVYAQNSSYVVTMEGVQSLRDEYIYYLFETDDHRIIPSARGKSGFTVKMDNIPSETPEIHARFKAVSLSGEQSDWSEMSSYKGFSSEVSCRPQPFREAPNLSSPQEAEAYCGGSISGFFDGIKRVDWLVLTAAKKGAFPSEFSIEYTMDSGEHWQEIPSANFSHFPDPAKNKVWIPLRGLAVNGVRVFSRKLPPAGKTKYQLTLGSIEAFSAGALRFEASGAPDGEVAAWNNLWLVYGEAGNEIHELFDPRWPAARPYSGGVTAVLATEWAEWNAKQLCWNNSPMLKKFRDFVGRYFVNEEGYVYVDPDSEKHLDHNRHYTTNPSFLSGVSYYILMTGDTDFLAVKDPRSGESIASKLERAMRFMLEDCGGNSGLVTIHDPAADGTPSSFGNNYWDVFLFGHQSAYMNMLFYHALERSVQLQHFIGNHKKADTYQALMPLVKKRFNETFWDNEKGRYISWICKEGKGHDFGCTFVNLPAIRYGLADPDQARSIFDWLDGSRLILSDTAQGADIYHHRIAPRVNTLAAEEDSAYWKGVGGFLKAEAGGSGAYGNDIQNGGFVFYVSYYDLMARLLFDSPESAERRAKTILREFNQSDQLRWQNVSRNGVGTDCGIIREFSESGMVPYFFISGILGIEPVADGLSIHPTLPVGWDTARVNRFHFRGSVLDIIADRTAQKYSVKRSGNRVELTVPNGEKTLFQRKALLN